jgi:hypothetical protein
MEWYLLKLRDNFTVIDLSTQGSGQELRGIPTSAHVLFGPPQHNFLLTAGGHDVH